MIPSDGYDFFSFFSSHVSFKLWKPLISSGHSYCRFEGKGGGREVASTNFVVSQISDRNYKNR